MRNGREASSPLSRATLATLLDRPELIVDVATADIPALLSAVTALSLALTAELLARPLIAPASTGSTSGADQLLRAKEVAERMGCSIDYVYRHAGQLPFVIRQGRSLRFSEAGLARYIRSRTAE